MANQPQAEIHNQSYPAPSSHPSSIDDKANYDDPFDEYTAEYKNPSRPTLSIQSPTLAHPPTPQHRRNPSFPANNQSQTSLSHKTLWDYPPSSSESAVEKELSRPFWQKVLFTSSERTYNDLISPRFQLLPDSLYCRLYVLTVAIQTAIDLAIEGELLVRFHQADLGLGDDTAAATRKSLNVYLGIFALAQYVIYPLTTLLSCHQGFYSVFQMVMALDAVYNRNTLQVFCLT
jgi:hypothetical protein